MFRKFVTLPTSTLLAAVAVQNASSSEPNKQEPVIDLTHYHCKSTELPLYAPLHSYNK